MSDKTSTPIGKPPLFKLNDSDTKSISSEHSINADVTVDKTFVPGDNTVLFRTLKESELRFVMSNIDQPTLKHPETSTEESEQDKIPPSDENMKSDIATGVQSETALADVLAMRLKALEDHYQSKLNDTIAHFTQKIDVLTDDN